MTQEQHNADNGAAQEPLRLEHPLDAGDLQYPAIIAALAEGIVIMDAAGRIRECNPSAERILGLTKSQMTGRTSLDPRWKAIHEDGTPFPGETHPVMLTLRTGKPLTGVVMGIQRPDGRSMWISINSQPLFAAGKAAPYGVVATFHDITDRKRAEEELRASEERYRLLADNVEDFVSLEDVDGKHLYVCPSYYRVTGWTPEEIAASNWRARMHPDDLPVIERAKALAKAGETTRFEHRIRCRNGAWIWVEQNYKPLLDADGKLRKIILWSHDITRLKQAQETLKQAHEEQLRRQRTELAHMARLNMMGEMAASLAHELNQPLHAVNNYAQGSLVRLAKAPQQDAELVTALEQIAEETRRAAEIVRRVRRFVQKDDEPRFADVQVNSLVEEAVLLSKAAVGQRCQARVILEQCADLPSVVGDSVQIEQVIMNLVHNSLEAMEEMPEADRLLIIKTLRPDDATIGVDVCDRGAGIGHADRARIFEPFFTTKPEGMGMGLAICRSIVEAHGGRLWFSTDQPSGCTFHFTLPVGKRS